MERDGYVGKVREATGTGEEDIFWVVGPRGKVEVGEAGVRGLVGAVHADEEREELMRRVERSLGTGMKLEKRDGGDDRKRGRKRKERGEEEEGRGGRVNFLEQEQGAGDDEDDDEE